MNRHRSNGPKRVAQALTAMSLAGALAACGATGDSSSQGGSADGKTVGVQFCPESNAWCAAWLKTFEAKMADAGVKTIVLTSNFNQAEDNQHIGQLVAKKPDIIVMGAADGNAAVPAILRAAAAGMKLVNVVGPLPDAAQKSLAANVVSDNAAVGRYAAENLVEGMKKAGYDKGNVIVLSGAQASPPVQHQLDGFKEVMAKSPEYKLVSIQDAQWDPQKTQQMASQLLAEYNSKGGIQGIYASADYMAAGAIRAVKQAGHALGAGSNDGVLVVASNCSADGPPLIKAGDLYGSATLAPAPEAEAAAEVVLSILNGDKVEKDTFVKEEKITHDNVDSFTGVCSY